MTKRVSEDPCLWNRDKSQFFANYFHSYLLQNAVATLSIFEKKCKSSNPFRSCSHMDITELTFSRTRRK